jgi:WD40 repeat protein
MDSPIQIEKIIPEDNLEIMTLQWNSDDSLLALGCSDGTVKIHSESGLLNTLHLFRGDGFPVTSVRWKPPVGKTRNILLVTTSDGRFFQFHGPSGRMMFESDLPDNQIFSSDYSPDSMHFALACKDNSIRVVDDTTKTVVNTFGPPQGYSPGHSSRVYAIKWSQNNLLVSAGWDDKVIVWDPRDKVSSRVILGPHICGEALDVKDNLILTGSYSSRQQVQLWSLDSGKNFYSSELNAQEKDCLVYTAQFSKQSRGFVVGGSGSDEAYFFTSDPYKPLAVLENLRKPIYSCDFCNTNQMLALGCGDGSSVICSVNFSYSIT